MNILFITDNYPPEVNAPATRTFEHCREWVALGHRVTVVTGAPNFPKGELLDGYRNKLWQRERMDGIDVVRVWTFITANDGFLLRTLDYLSFGFSAALAGLFMRAPDLIIATSPQLFSPLAAYAIGLVKRRPYIFELRDLWPESIRAVGAIKSSRVLDSLEKLELFLYRKAAHVVSNTHSFKDNLIGRGIASDHISVVLNGVDLQRFCGQPRDLELRSRLGLDGKLVVGYVGTMGMAHGLGTLLDAAERLQSRPDIAFLLVGDGARKQELQEDAAGRGLHNLQFVDSVPRDRVAAYWSVLDLAVIHLRNEPLFATVIPSKLFECMAMGLPVLHGVRGESAEIVEREAVGITFEPEDAAGLVSAIFELANDPGRCQSFQKNSRAAAKRYDRRCLARSMLEIVIPFARAGNALSK